MKKYLYRYTMECYKQINSIFVADEESVKNTFGKQACFGGNIYDTLHANEFVIISDDADFIEKFEKLGCCTGPNPLEKLV